MDNADERDGAGLRPQHEGLLVLADKIDAEKEQIQRRVFPLSEAARASLKMCGALERNGFVHDAEASRVYAAARYLKIADIYRENGFAGIADSYERTAKELRSRRGRRR